MYCLFGLESLSIINLLGYRDWSGHIRGSKKVKVKCGSGGCVRLRVRLGVFVSGRESSLVVCRVQTC